MRVAGVIVVVVVIVVMVMVMRNRVRRRLILWWLVSVLGRVAGRHLLRRSHVVVGVAVVQDQCAPVVIASQFNLVRVDFVERGSDRLVVIKLDHGFVG